MDRRGKLIAVNGIPVGIRKSEATPQTVGEVAADRPSQRADREAIDQLHAWEREQVVLYSIFHAHGTSRARQLEVSARLDELEGLIAAYRQNLAGKTQRVAKTDGLGIGAPKQLDTLGTLLRTPDLRKNELPDPLELSNSLGIRSQAQIKE